MQTRCSEKTISQSLLGNLWHYVVLLERDRTNFFRKQSFRHRCAMCSSHGPRYDGVGGGREMLAKPVRTCSIDASLSKGCLHLQTTIADIIVIVFRIDVGLYQVLVCCLSKLNVKVK